MIPQTKLQTEAGQTRNHVQVSCAELDLLADTALEQEGVWGSRMTGAGFGGCVLSLVAAEKLEEVRAGLGFRV